MRTEIKETIRRGAGRKFEVWEQDQPCCIPQCMAAFDTRAEAEEYEKVRHLKERLRDEIANSGDC